MKSTNELKVIRVRCEHEFLFFVRYFFKKRFGHKFVLNSHHYKIAEALNRVVQGETKRLLINIPPRYSKTELAVVCFIAWCIAKWPRSKFIHLSYSDDLALDNSSQIKELIESDEFQELWQVSLKDDSQSKKKWYTTDRGGLYATSTGGAVTGFGAGSTDDEIEFGGALIIDDPLKPDDAESKTVRKKINNRLNNTVKSRLNHRNTPIIMIMQRLHDEDPSGFVLNDGTGEDWEHLMIPALKDGKALWEWKHTVEDLERLRKADKWTFAGQYQQNPVPDDGAYFSKESFNRYEKLPDNLTFYGASDYAATEDGGDFTEHGVFGLSPDDKIYIANWWSGQTKSDVWVEEQLDLVQKHKVKRWAGETGPIKASVEPWLTKRMRQRRVYTTLKWLSHSQANKETHARAFQALVEAGIVYVPMNEWGDALIDQLVRFPKGVFDDKVDVCSLFARMIDEIWSLSGEDEKKEKKRDRWDRAFDDDEADDWKVA